MQLALLCYVCCILQPMMFNVRLCSQWHCLRRFSLYEPVEFINTFLKDKLEWNQVTFVFAHCLPFSLVWRLLIASTQCNGRF